MEAILPIFFCLILPAVWTVAVFAAGRWSANNRIRLERRGEAAGAASPYYDGFEEV